MSSSHIQQAPQGAQSAAESMSSSPIQQAPQDDQSNLQTKMDQIRAALENLEPGDGNVDVKARFKEMLRPTVKQVAAQKKALNSAVTNETIVDIVVAMLQQQGNNVLDEVALRQIIRQILVEEYPGSENAQDQNNDEQLNAQLKEQLRTIVKAIGKNLQDSGITLSDESLAERVIAKAKQNGWKIVDEAGMKQQILQLIAEEFPATQNDPTKPAGAVTDSPTMPSPASGSSPSRGGTVVPTTPSPSSGSSPSTGGSAKTWGEAASILGKGGVALGVSDVLDPSNIAHDLMPEAFFGIELTNILQAPGGMTPEPQKFVRTPAVSDNKEGRFLLVNPEALRSIDEALLKTGPTVVHQLTIEDSKPKMISGLKLTNTTKTGLASNWDMEEGDWLHRASTKIRYVTVIAEGKEVTSYSFFEGFYIYDFDFAQNLVVPEEKRLAGWTWHEQGSSKWMAKPAIIQDVDLVVEAIFVPKQYSVTCNGLVTMVNYGAALSDPTVTAPAGKALDHWEWRIASTNAVIPKPAVMPNFNLVAIPVWKDVVTTYTLTINGASSAVAPGTALTVPGTPDVPVGNSFGGWKWTVGGVETEKMPATMPAANVTGTPIFTPNYYNLTVNGATTQKAYGSPISLTPPAAEEGYEFNCWECTVNGVGVATVPSTMPAADVVAKATFKLRSYRLVFTNGLGTTLQDKLVEFGSVVSYAADPVYEGKRFIGWDQTVITMPAHDVTINARWEDKVPPATEVIPDEGGGNEDGAGSGETLYTVTFSAPGVDDTAFRLKEGDPIPYSQATPPKGYAWNRTYETMPAENIYITASIPAA